MQSLINYSNLRIKQLTGATERASDETVKQEFLAKLKKWQEFLETVESAGSLDEVNAKGRELGISFL